MFGSPQNDQEFRSVARKMFFLGFLFLPGVWVVLLCTFRNYWKEGSPEARDIRWYMKMAAVGAVLEIGMLIAWMSVYLTSWQTWGATGDKLNVITYVG
eukprot:m51a1_g2482 putative presenilin enhancer (98) ;mRNA; f:75340-75830